MTDEFGRSNTRRKSWQDVKNPLSLQRGNSRQLYGDYGITTVEGALKDGVKAESIVENLSRRSSKELVGSARNSPAGASSQPASGRSMDAFVGQLRQELAGPGGSQPTSGRSPPASAGQVPFTRNPFSKDTPEHRERTESHLSTVQSGQIAHASGQTAYANALPFASGSPEPPSPAMLNGSPNGLTKGMVRNSSADSLFRTMTPEAAAMSVLPIAPENGKTDVNTAQTPETSLARQNCSQTPDPPLRDPFSSTLLNPYTRGWTIWSTVVTVMTCVISVYTPFEFSFTTEEQNTGLLFAFWDLFSTLIFSIDILVNLNTKVEIVDKRTGKPSYLLRRWDILMVYLRGWLIIDVISVFPFKYLGLVKHRGHRILRVLRMLRLIRLVQASFAWEHVSTKSTSTVSHAMKDLWKLILYTLLLAHWFSCVMMLAAYKYERYGYIQLQSKGIDGLSWISALADSGKIKIDDVEGDPRAAYLYAFYWSLMTLTTVGYGDIAPQNHTEHLCAVVIMLIAGFFWAWVLGTFCNITVSLNEATTAYKQACDNMNLMIRDEGMSVDLGRSLRLYMRRARHVLKAKHQAGVIHLLSPELQGRVVFESLGSGWLPSTPLIGNGHRSFVVDISRVMQVQLFCIMEKIQEYRTLIVVRHGVCVRGGQLIRKDSVWGEDLILECQHLRDERCVVCLTFTETNTLCLEGLREVLARRPREQPRIRKYLVRLACKRGIVYLARVKLCVEFEHGGAELCSRAGRKNLSMSDYSTYTKERAFISPSHAYLSSTSTKKDLFKRGKKAKEEEVQPGSATAPLPLPSQGMGRQLSNMVHLKRQMSQQRQMTIARIREQKLGGVRDIRHQVSATGSGGTPTTPIDGGQTPIEATRDTFWRSVSGRSPAAKNAGGLTPNMSGLDISPSAVVTL
jgi:voltage-gated potassium channel